MGSNISRRKNGRTKAPRTVEGYLRKLRYVNKVINDSYYSNFVDHMKELMQSSLDPGLLGDPVGHFDLQKVIYIALEKLEPLITQGRQEAVKTSDKSLLVQAHRNKLIATAYREIADGIAWRTLGHERARIRILSEANSPGPISTPDGPKIGRGAEFHYAHNVVNGGAFVLMHDVTNQFLVGDLSMVRNFGDIPHLAEVKSKKLITPSTIIKKVEREMELSPQEHRLIQAQLLLDKDEIGFFKKPVKVRRIDIPVATFHEEVRNRIHIARKKGISTGMPASYMHIEIIDFTNHELISEDLLLKERPFNGHKILQFTNYDSLAMKMDGKIMRGKPPYSVYPYPPSDRIDIMTGNLYILATISITELKKEFFSRGWRLEVNFPNDRQPYEDVKFGGKELFRGMSEDDLVVSLHNVQTGFTTKLGMELFTRIGYEFFTIDDVLIPFIEKMKEDITFMKFSSAYVFPINDAENKLWD